MYLVKEKYQDDSGHWLARVEIDSSRTAFFKFGQEPSQEQIDIAVTTMLEGEEQMRKIPEEVIPNVNTENTTESNL